MKNLSKEILENIALEAFDLHQKIDIDKRRLLELKKQIIEDSKGKNTSYKILLVNGIVRINRFKESISYDFDKETFEKLDNETKDKFINEEIIKVKLDYFLNKNKIEIIKSKNEFKKIDDLITENNKDAHFTVSFWKNKNESTI